MKSYFLKNCFFGIVALITVVTNTLKPDGINNGDCIILKPTSHFQDHSLIGYYEKAPKSFESEDGNPTGNQRCQLEAGSYTWCITAVIMKGDKPFPIKVDELYYGTTVTLKSQYYKFIEAGHFTHTGGYLSARSEDEGYSVSADRENALGWETWTLINPDKQDDTSPIPNKGKVALKSIWGTFLCADSNKHLIADRKAIGAWEIWTIEKEQ